MIFFFTSFTSFTSRGAGGEGAGAGSEAKSRGEEGRADGAGGRGEGEEVKAAEGGRKKRSMFWSEFRLFGAGFRRFTGGLEGKTALFPL